MVLNFAETAFVRFQAALPCQAVCLTIRRFGFSKPISGSSPSASGGGKQNQGDFSPICACVQRTSSFWRPMPRWLAGGIDGKIRQIAGVSEVGKRSGQHRAGSNHPIPSTGCPALDRAWLYRRVRSVVGRRMPERSSTPVNRSAVMVLLLLYSDHLFASFSGLLLLFRRPVLRWVPSIAPCCRRFRWAKTR